MKRASSLMIGATVKFFSMCLFLVQRGFNLEHKNATIYVYIYKTKILFQSLLFVGSKRMSTNCAQAQQNETKKGARTDGPIFGAIRK